MLLDKSSSFMFKCNRVLLKCLRRNLYLFRLESWEFEDADSFFGFFGTFTKSVEVKDAIPKQNPNKPPLQVKSICLLMAHMHNLLTDEDKKNPDIAADLDKILRTIPSYIDIMLSQTMMLSQAFKMGQSPKKITAKNIMTLIQFSQNLMQGGWINKDQF